MKWYRGSQTVKRTRGQTVMAVEKWVGMIKTNERDKVLKSQKEGAERVSTISGKKEPRTVD